MKRVLFFVALVALFGFQSKGLEKRVVGVWRYDTNSLRMVLDPAHKKRLEAEKSPSEVKRTLAILMEGLRGIVKTMEITFGADKTFAARSPKFDRTIKGTWSLKGNEVRVSVPSSPNPPPRMTLSKDGRRIQTEFKQPGTGAGYVDLVPAKPAPR